MFLLKELQSCTVVASWLVRSSPNRVVPRSSPGRGNCVVFLAKRIYSHSASFHPCLQMALPAYLSAELEQLQKRATRIIFPFVSYSDALHQANLETLSRCRQSITTKLFDSITCNPDHKLYELLPPRNKEEF